MISLPEHLVFPLAEFSDAHTSAVDRGREVLRDASVAFVGLARDCARQLEANLRSVADMSSGFRSWMLHIESNDCIDDTHGVLSDFCFAYQSRASFRYQSLSRERYGSEFGGRRTQALAEYRTACQEWVRESASHCDFVAVIDFDMGGGWSREGFSAGVGTLNDMTDAYGMASVGLAMLPMVVATVGDKQVVTEDWRMYDAWALRGVGQESCYWDAYTAGYGGWSHGYIPPVGSPPVLVASAFGGMAVYKTADYLSGQYDGSNDCEHVSFHRSVNQATSGRLYLCPSMRTFM
jgi:hypothetical protein